MKKLILFLPKLLWEIILLLARATSKSFLFLYKWTKVITYWLRYVFLVLFSIAIGAYGLYWGLTHYVITNVEYDYFVQELNIPVRINGYNQMPPEQKRVTLELMKKFADQELVKLNK